MKKFSRLITMLMLILSLTTPLIAQASSSSPPIDTWDFYSYGLYREGFGGYGYSSDYSGYKFSPIGNGTTIPMKIDAGTFGRKNNQLRVECIDAATDESVSSKTIYATEHQYITFKNLNPSHYYYFQFVGYDVGADVYISENGLFNFTYQSLLDL